MTLLKTKCSQCGEQMIDDGNSYIYCRDADCNWCVSKDLIKGDE